MRHLQMIDANAYGAFSRLECATRDGVGQGCLARMSEAHNGRNKSSKVNRLAVDKSNQQQQVPTGFN
jgi:hypothetical protein